MLTLPLTFDRTLTLGNPMRDLALPTFTWTIMCKAIELCLVYSSGGPRPIRLFMGKTLVRNMDERHYGEYEWREVEFPPLWSWGRVVYGLDVLGLRRVGTSLLFPKEGRALQWSKKGLNEWSRYLKVNNCRAEDIPAHSSVRRFGQPEMPLYAAMAQLLIIHMAFRWLYALSSPSSELINVLGLYIPIGSAFSRKLWYSILPSYLHKPFILLGTPTSAFDLPFLTRLGMTASLGGAVCLGPGAIESIPLLFWTPTPATSFLSAFERPITSPGLARLWARSWHSMSQRDYLSFAAIMPFSGNQVMQMLFVFFWSGVQHSWMFARLRTSPNERVGLGTVVKGMIDPRMVGFFLCQAAGILIERAAMEKMPAGWKKQRRLIGVGKRVWMFTVLAVPGALFLDSILQRGLMTKDVLDGFGFRALGLMVRGKKY